MALQVKNKALELMLSKKVVIKNIRNKYGFENKVIRAYYKDGEIFIDKIELIHGTLNIGSKNFISPMSQLIGTLAHESYHALVKEKSLNLDYYQEELNANNIGLEFSNKYRIFKGEELRRRKKFTLDEIKDIYTDVVE